MQASSCKVAQYADSAATFPLCVSIASHHLVPEHPSPQPVQEGGQRSRIHFPMQRKASFAPSFAERKPFYSSVSRPLPKDQLQHYPFKGVFKAVHPLSSTYFLHPINCDESHFSPPIALPFLLLMIVHEKKTQNMTNKKQPKQNYFSNFMKGVSKSFTYQCQLPFQQAIIINPLPTPPNKQHQK